MNGGTLMNVKRILSAALFMTFFSCAGAPVVVSAMHTTNEAWQAESRLEYIYNYDGVYEVFARKGYVVDVTLKSGETVSGVVAGDTARWMVETATIGTTPHVFIKPTEDGIKTNFLIYTNSRVYHLSVTEQNQYTPIIRWSYPEDVYKPKEITPAEAAHNEIFADTVDGQLVYKTLNRDYRFKGSKRVNEALYPLEVFDDGVRTYIRLGENNKYDLPVLYRVEGKKKLTLINYRIRHGYIIADRVFDHARLKYSASEYVDIFPKEAVQ
jgi:P-type conjugative transfer protein trbG